ncbi:hypothetical protein Scep_015398 [Stephania cephalantha]|uniref:Fe2OG dioxygenase domain-containing protein n=1 Tax=Stephania cephalantha TaxID=152367 RepID=A0AAP0J2T0_9MAGN
MSPAIGLVSYTESEREDGHEQSKYQRGVKHLCESGITRVPSKYVLPAQERPNIKKEISERNMSNGRRNISLPIIDFAELQGSNRSKALKNLSNACEEFGFFQVVNHGISIEIIRHMMDVSRRFFELPFEERSKYMTSDMRSPARYGTSFNQNKDGVFCWRDFLKLICPPSSNALSLWPTSPSNLRQAVVSYSTETRFLFTMLMEAVLECLGLIETSKNNYSDEEEFTLKDFGDGSQLMVINCYPACPEPELTLGMPPHSDYGFLTLLLQDEVEGLQIQNRGKWVTVEPIPHSFVVNVGDHLEIFSNGKYKSVLHRVLVNSTKSRISVASLHSMSFEQVIRPSPKLIDEHNPRRYMDTDFTSFLNYASTCEPKRKNFLESRKLAV